MNEESISFFIVFVFCSVMLLAFSLSASAAYEPDGTTSVEYEFDAAECNRTLIVNCVDENGTHLKTVQFEIKRGEETSAVFSLGGYDIIAFESTQGLWETCTLSWASSNRYDYTWVYIRYYFRTGLSQDSVTATVVMRKHLPCTVKVRHFLRSKYSFEYGGRWYEYKTGSEFVVSYGDPFYCSAQEFEGHYLMNGYETQVETVHLPNGYPKEINGNFSYSLIKDTYGITDIKDFMEWDVVDDDGYKDISHQLYLTDGGFGAEGGGRGRACFCWDLYSQERDRIERPEVIGIVPPEKLPDFAKATLAKIESGELTEQKYIEMKTKKKEGEER